MKPESCKVCPLYKAPGPLWGHGPPDASLVIILDAPSLENINGLSYFSEYSGRSLSQALRKSGLDRSSVFITGAIKCHGKISESALKCCEPLLKQETEPLKNVHCTLAIGREWFNRVTGRSLKLVTDRSSNDSWLRGCPITYFGQVIVPTFSPTRIPVTGFNDQHIFDSDVEKAVRCSMQVSEYKVAFNERLNYSPSESEVQEYVKKCISVSHAGIDIETSNKRITVIGLSCEKGEAIGVPPSMHYLLEPLLKSEVTLYAHSWAFDKRELMNVMSVGAVRAFDTMLALNLLHPLLQHKDLGMALSLYTDMPFHKNLEQNDANRYNARDTYGALWLGLVLYKKLIEQRMYDLFYDIVMPQVDVIISLVNSGGLLANCEYANHSIARYNKLSRLSSNEELKPIIEALKSESMVASRVGANGRIPLDYMIHRNPYGFIEAKPPIFTEDKPALINPRNLVSTNQNSVLVEVTVNNINKLTSDANQAVDTRSLFNRGFARNHYGRRLPINTEQAAKRDAHTFLVKSDSADTFAKYALLPLYAAFGQYFVFVSECTILLECPTAISPEIIQAIWSAVSESRVRELDDVQLSPNIRVGKNWANLYELRPQEITGTTRDLQTLLEGFTP